MIKMNTCKIKINHHQIFKTFYFQHPKILLETSP